MQDIRHYREEVVKRFTQEFERLDFLVADLTHERWEQHPTRSEIKDPWTVKVALAHTTFRKPM